ncbi:hypothetical protein [Vibrio nigripulchritudo]|uniref:hypothetical protein n=1 Tax=Vibrio nigripulchritudo TaxID=28173 RepID=UPI0003B23B49|nr:hypothetical protein [Vibrio nigripulchritudo]CCN72371.1 exported hypothetical protein [Vibrio nigripulchritudo SFn118]
MNKITIFALTAFFTFSSVPTVHANVLNELKSTPLSAYDAGKNQLKSLVAAFNIAVKLDGKKRETPKFTVIEKESLLGVDIQGFERAKNVTEKYCLEQFGKLSSLGISSEVPQILWPSVSGEDSLKLQKELFVQVTIVAKENHNFKVSCSKTLAEI